MIYKLAEHKNEYLHLPILPSIQEQAWKQSQHHSHTIARHNSYINYLSLYTLIDWFRNEQSLAEPVIYPSAKSLSSIWEVVNGAGIKLGERQIVIIPCEISEFEEFSVPQEWVDIPEWVGDYYLAIQVNLEPEEDECWIEVCGFTTHSYLKNLGKYNFHDRTYAITVDNLIQDITVMEITLPLEMKAEIPELPHLSAVKAEELLQVFANSSIYSPRLRVNDITFEEWAALLVNDSWRQQLYEQRMGELVISSNLVSTNTTKAAQGISSKIDHIVAWITNRLENIRDLVKPIFEHNSEILIPELKNAHLPIAYEAEPITYFQPLDAFLEHLIPNPVIEDPVIVKLGNWVQGKFELDWQPQRDLLERMTVISKKTPSPVMKSSPVMRDINLVLETPSEEDLVNDIRNTQDDSKRWQSAELLWQKNPQHSACPIISAKDLGVYLLGYSLALMVGIVPKSDGEILIILRVYSLEQEPYLLPTRLKLTITDLRDNIVVTTMESQTGDIYIESKINGSSGEYFSVTVTLSDSSFTQEFVI